MNEYLKIMMSLYNDGKWLRTNLELMAQQSEMEVDELMDFLRKNGVNFIYQPHWFTPKDQNPIHNKGGDMIAIYKRMGNVVDLKKL